MTSPPPIVTKVSNCCLCKHYQSVGTRGGNCDRLGVPVQGSWDACSLACAPFLDLPAYKAILQKTFCSKLEEKQVEVPLEELGTYWQHNHWAKRLV